MKGFSTFFVLIIAFVSFGQKIEREYYSNLKVEKEWQVDKNGVKNGYFKHFSKDGILYEVGQFKDGLESGKWIRYGNWTMDGRLLSHPSETAEISNYINGKLDGSSQSWQWKGTTSKNGWSTEYTRYLLTDAYYKEGVAIRYKEFYSNGKLKYEKDIEKNIFNEWFDDGTPKLETIDGKTIKYANKGIVEKITFDSLGKTYSFRFDLSYNNLCEILIKGESEEMRIEYCTKIFPEIKIMKSGSDESWLSEKIKPVELDSINVRLAYLAYNNAPNPNNSNKKILYDETTGDVKIYDPLNKFNVYHFKSSPKMAYTVLWFDENGVLTYFQDIQEVFNESNNSFTKRENIIKNYNKGILWKYQNIIEDYLIEYYPDGQKKFEKYNINEALKRDTSYEKEFYQNGNIKYFIVKNKNGHIVEEKSFYSNNLLKMEWKRELAEMGYSRDYQHVFYDELGNIQSIGTDSDFSRISVTLSKLYTKMFEAIFNKDKYEYPLSQETYAKLKKVVDGFNLNITNAKNIDEIKSTISNYKAFIDKLIKIASVENTDLNVQLKNVKKTDQIKSVVFDWKN